MEKKYDVDGRKKRTFKTDDELKTRLEAKGQKKVIKGPVYKPKAPPGHDKPGYYVQYEKQPGVWMYLGRSKDDALANIG